MKCTVCGGKMEDTKEMSFGTGEPIHKCTKCGWTGLYKNDKIEFAKEPEDVFYNGIKYKDYRAVIKVNNAEGKPLVEFTTWRADIITEIMKAGKVLQAFEPGCVLSISASPETDHETIN